MGSFVAHIQLLESTALSDVLIIAKNALLALIVLTAVRDIMVRYVQMNVHMVVRMGIVFYTPVNALFVGKIITGRFAVRIIRQGQTVPNNVQNIVRYVMVKGFANNVISATMVTTVPKHAHRAAKEVFVKFLMESVLMVAAV